MSTNKVILADHQRCVIGLFILMMIETNK